jgi:hypothetical protein
MRVPAASAKLPIGQGQHCHDRKGKVVKSWCFVKWQKGSAGISTNKSAVQCQVCSLVWQQRTHNRARTIAEPGVSAYVPGAHGTQLELPTPENVPGGHGSHVVMSAER